MPQTSRTRGESSVFASVKTLLICDSSTLLTGPAGLEQAKGVIAQYKQNKIPFMTPDLWSAKKIVDATLHPGMG